MKKHELNTVSQFRIDSNQMKLKIAGPVLIFGIQF